MCDGLPLRSLLGALVCVCLVGICRAEEPAPEETPHRASLFRWTYEGPPYRLEESRRNNLLARFSRDLTIQFQAPGRYAFNHPWRFGLGLTALGGLVASDPETLDWLTPDLKDNDSDVYRISNALSQSGKPVYALSLVAGFGLYGWLGDSSYEMETCRLTLEALVTATLWTEIIKVGTGRTRPRHTEGYRSDWTGPGGLFGNQVAGRSYKSFPSGHSSATWALATVIARRYPRGYWVPILCYTAASAMSYSRMAVDAHWPSDVVVGSALGYLCARQVLRDNGGEDWRWGPVTVDGISLDLAEGRVGAGLRLSVDLAGLFPR